MPSPPSEDWLAGCDGFVVESDGRRLGRVEEVERAGDTGRPVALVVRGAKPGGRRLLVPVGDVAGVIPSSGRIVLSSTS